MIEFFCTGGDEAGQLVRRKRCWTFPDSTLTTKWSSSISKTGPNNDVSTAISSTNERLLHHSLGRPSLTGSLKLRRLRSRAQQQFYYVDNCQLLPKSLVPSKCCCCRRIASLNVNTCPSRILF